MCRSWGPRKVKAWLEAREPGRDWPAASTIGGLFDRAGLTRPRQRRRRVQPQSFPFSACRAANDVWCADFKGWFLTGDGTHVEPLTLSDGHSRYLLRCQAVGRADDAHVWPVFEACFHEFGLPLAVRSDNGLCSEGFGKDRAQVSVRQFALAEPPRVCRRLIFLRKVSLWNPMDQ